MKLELSQDEINAIIREHCQKTMSIRLIDIISYKPFIADIAPIIKKPLDENDI